MRKPVREREPRLREARNLVKHLIRVASESSDFYRTVDFITREAALTVEAARTSHKQQTALVGHLVPSSALTHEHMVPGEVVLSELAQVKAPAPLQPVLEPLTYRALVCKQTEIQKLDAPALKSALPPIAQTRLAIRPEELTRWPQFKALMRYDATGLLDDLLPITTRAVDLKEAYLAWKS